jgi:hypothetical protein
MVDISRLQMMMFVCFFFQGSITAAIWMHKITRKCSVASGSAPLGNDNVPQHRPSTWCTLPRVARPEPRPRVAPWAPAWRRGAQLVNMDGRMDGTWERKVMVMMMVMMDDTVDDR